MANYYYPRCPNCGSEKRTEDKVAMIYVCGKCEAVYGECSRGQSYSYVLPLWEVSEYKQDDVRYFDFQVFDPVSGADERRHGWYNIRTKRIVQVG